MNASELSKLVTDALENGTADEALATQVAADFAAMEPMVMYHFVVQVTGAAKQGKQKEALQAFNLLLNKQPPFIEAMAKLNKAKDAGELAKPA